MLYKFHPTFRTRRALIVPDLVALNYFNTQEATSTLKHQVVVFTNLFIESLQIISFFLNTESAWKHNDLSCDLNVVPCMVKLILRVPYYIEPRSLTLGL